MKHLFSQHLYWVLSALLLSVVICEDDSPRLPTTNAKSPLRRFEPRKPQKEETKKSVYSQPPDDPPSTTSVSLDWKDVAQNSNRTLDHLSRNTVPVYAPTEPTGKLVRKNGSPGPGPLLAFKSVTTRTFPEGESIPPTGWALASLKNTIRPYNPTKRPLTTPPIKPISDYWSNRLAKTTTPSTFLDIQQDATVSSKNETEPTKNITEPTKNELEPAKNETEPTKNETEPVKNETEPAKNETEPAKLETEPPKIETKFEDSTEKTENLKINSTNLDIIIKNVSAVENLVKEVKIQNNINETVENVKNETKIDQSTTSMTRATNVTNIPTEKTSTEAIVEKSETLTTIGNDIPDVAVKYKNYTSAPILERNISATTILPFPTMNATSEILTTLSQLEENTTFVENSNSSLSPEITTQFSISKNDENTTKNFTTPSITERIDLEETTFHSKNYTLPNSIIEETTISTKAKKVEKPENETLTTKIYENKTEKTIFENNDIKLRITTPLPTEETKETTKKIETTEPSKGTTVQVTTETPKMTTETPKMTTETPKMTERAKTEQKITSESAKTTEHAKTTTELYLSVPTKNLSGFHYDVENKTESTPIIFRETVDIDEEDSLLYNTTSNDKNDEDDDEDEMDKEEHSSTKTTNSTETPKMTPPIKKIPEETTTEIDENMFDTGVVIPMDVEIIVQAMYSEMCDEKDELKYSIVKLFKTYAGKSVSPKQVLILDLGPQECYENNELMYVSPAQIHLRMTNQNGEYSKTLTELLVGLIRQGHFQFKFPVNRVDTLVSHQVEMEGQLGGTVIAAIVISSIAAVSLLFLTILLVIMRKRQKGFNYGQRCTPVSLDDYSLDNISVYNSVRRKALRASKRSYGNPAFDDPVAVSLPLNFAGLSNAVSDKSKLEDEFSKVPTVTVKMDELPLGAEIKNRYANVIPLPETQVRINSSTTNDVIEQFINANYVKGAKGADKFYIACQAPLPNTIADFWQMIWEQQSKIIIMLTNLHENGVEKCADYLPPSEVLDCHRVFGDLQITLKKREAREKYIISNLQIKNLETNLWREVTHMWYTSWPARGVPDDTSSIIAFLIEARSYAKSGPPVVVHCSPGTGRTGTVIAIDIAIRDFETDRIVDIPKTVYAIRKERAGAVQTREQYRLIYDVLHLYATKLTGGGLDSI